MHNMLKTVYSSRSTTSGGMLTNNIDSELLRIDLGTISQLISELYTDDISTKFIETNPNSFFLFVRVKVLLSNFKHRELFEAIINKGGTY